MRKKILTVIFILLFSLTVITSYAENEIKVIVNDQEVIFDVQPRIVNGRTLVPMRAIFEALGATVKYEDDTGTITATKENTKIVLKFNSTEAKVNDKLIILEVPATLIEGRTLVPVRFIAESLDMDVSWVSNTWKVIIKEKDKTPKTYTEIKTQNISGNNIKPSVNDVVRIDVSGQIFDAQTGKVTIELQLFLRPNTDFRLLDETGDNTALYIKSKTSYDRTTESYSIYFSVYDKDGVDTKYIFYEEAYNPLAYSLDGEFRKVNMTVVADTNTQKASIHIDGNLRLEEQNFAQPVNNIGICSFTNANLISVNKTLKTGELEKLKTNFVSIAPPKARDLLLPGINRDIQVFDPQKGIIIVDADFDYGISGNYQLELLDETGQKTAVLIKPGGGHMRYNTLLAIEYKNENSWSTYGFASYDIIENNKIVHLRIVVDIAAQKVDVYVNGVLNLEKINFFEPVENIGRIEIHSNGTVVLKNLMKD